MDNQTKVCIRCGKGKPVGQFYKNRTQKDGYHYYCKDCMKAYPKKGDEDQSAAKDKWMYPRFDSIALMNKYLRRYEKSLELAIRRQQELKEKKELRYGVLSYGDRLKERRYPAAIKEWEKKIANVKKQIKAYNKPKQEPLPPSMPSAEKQQPVKEKGIMTKEKLIELLNSVPAGAQVIHVSDTENQSSLVAVWANENGDTIIRRMVDKMPYICAEGNLFSLVSGGITKSKEE